MGNEAMPGPQRSRRPLKVGLILPQWTESYGGADPRWADLLAVARRAENVGFDSLWAVDDLHIHFDGKPLIGVWECWAVVAGLAAATERVELGTLVCSNNFRSPAVLAKIADTLEEMSGDRLILGLGAGGDEGEHRAFGLPWERRFDRLGEALAIVSELPTNRSLGLCRRALPVGRVPTRPARLAPRRSTPLDRNHRARAADAGVHRPLTPTSGTAGSPTARARRPPSRPSVVSSTPHAGRSGATRRRSGGPSASALPCRATDSPLARGI